MPSIDKRANEAWITNEACLSFTPDLAGDVESEVDLKLDNLSLSPHTPEGFGHALTPSNLINRPKSAQSRSSRCGNSSASSSMRNRPQSAHSRSSNMSCGSKGVRPMSTMQMLSDAVYQKEVQRLSDASKTSSKSSSIRPHTADMASGHLRSTFNPYQTSYKHEYYRKDGEELYGARPPSHIGLSSAPTLDETTYKKEYTGQNTIPNLKLWSGGNNPHPSQAFMVWKYPTKRGQSEEDNSNNHADPVLTNDAFDKVMRGKSKSTYQVDYRGLPPGNMPTEYIDVPKDWKTSVPYTLDSAQRISYQHPNQPKPLNNKTDRYGHSGHDRHRLLVGIAPNASQRRATLRSTTTYDRHYNEMAPLIRGAAGVHFPTHARTVVKGKGPSELSALYEQIKSQHFPRHTHTAYNSNPLNGYCNEVPIATPDPGIPRVSPGTGVMRIPQPDFITTPVPEPICEPV